MVFVISAELYLVLIAKRHICIMSDMTPLTLWHTRSSFVLHVMFAYDTCASDSSLTIIK